MTRYRATHQRPPQDHAYTIVVASALTLCVGVFVLGIIATILHH